VVLSCLRPERVPEHRSRRKPNEYVLSDSEGMTLRITQVVVVTQQTSQARTELDLYATRCTVDIRHLDLSAVGFIRKFYEKRFVTL